MEGMARRQVGSSGVEISRIGLGGIELGPEPGEVPDDERGRETEPEVSPRGTDTDQGRARGSGERDQGEGVADEALSSQHHEPADNSTDDRIVIGVNDGRCPNLKASPRPRDIDPPHLVAVRTIHLEHLERGVGPGVRPLGRVKNPRPLISPEGKIREGFEPR